MMLTQGINFQDGCILLLNDGIHAADPKFAALTGEKSELNDDDDEGEEENPIVFEDQSTLIFTFILNFTRNK